MEEAPVFRRGKNHIYAGWTIVVIILLSVSHFWACTIEQIAVVIAIPQVVLFLSQIIWRVCFLVEELKHVNKLCSGSYWELIWRALSFNTSSKLTGVVTIAIALQAKNITETWRDLGPVPFCLSFSSSIILHHIIGSTVCPTWEALVMKKFNGLDYGSGMAHSFFHGYLKLTLPANGDNLQGMARRIIKYMEVEQIREEYFPIKKLIVLIPRSGNLFALLSDEPSQVGGDPDITCAEKLQDHLRDRAGTKARVYRGGAYRVRVKTAGGKTLFLYTVAEGATPVKTFREACSAGSLEAEHLRQHRDDIVSNFYLTLNELITDDPELRHLVDLLYYDDVQSHVDVISLLKQHLLEAHNNYY